MALTPASPSQPTVAPSSLTILPPNWYSRVWPGRSLAFTAEVHMPWTPLDLHMSRIAISSSSLVGGLSGSAPTFSRTVWL